MSVDYRCFEVPKSDECVRDAIVEWMAGTNHRTKRNERNKRNDRVLGVLCVVIGPMWPMWPMWSVIVYGRVGGVVCVRGVPRVCRRFWLVL